MGRETPAYLFHWLALSKLERFQRQDILQPGWTHFILDEGRMVIGTSACEEPMLWNPDEGLPREPCLVLDASRIEVPIWSVQSSEAYHLTKKVKLALRAGKDIDPILAEARTIRSFSHGGWDEYFIEGPIPLSTVVAIGIEEGEGHHDSSSAKARKIAAELSLPVLDMTGWEVGGPGVDEVYLLVDEMLMEKSTRLPG